MRAQVPWHGALCSYSPLDTHRHPCVFWCLRVPVRAPLYALRAETCLSTCPSIHVPGHPLKLEMGCMIQDTGQGNQASLGHTGSGRLFLSPLDQCPEDVNACAYLYLHRCMCVQTFLCTRVSGVCVCMHVNLSCFCLRDPGLPHLRVQLFTNNMRSWEG